ncbi:Peptidase M15 [Rhizobium mongolense subsp. loessense]|uniref:Peptidase M15 n=1 Tax=Rhizobium mongolense subsp. loessense TaxID=158890 RepID=A0A1G4T5M5_9HYPH|nr:D-Ala-D-Ala carboxypeptidase family metallohydrolase [Rhizobium mongolense]SCW76708.1 Peptidase M15 [Rhizobium mongolense subsp. loessense]
MLILQKRVPAAGALLIAVAAVALSGCASNQKALDSAAVVATDPSAEQLAANTPGKTAKGAYRDPMVTNVSSAQQTAAAQESNAATRSAGAAATQPANIGGLAMQPSRINANAMSIFSAQPATPQNNTTSTIIRPADANAYAPAQVIDAARSSVFSAPPPAQPAQEGEMLLPQQSSEKTTTRLAPAYQTASLATGRLQGGSMNALYAAPKQNLVGGLAGLLEKASLPGMTRVAPNGLHIQNNNVEVGCFKPEMLNVIKAVETHFGKPVIVTSGYRDAGHNRMVGGAEESMHKTCDAADIKIDGVSKWDIAAFIRSLPTRGGVGTYCHTESVHLDTGKSRDWNWGCGAGRTRTPNARAI